MANDSTNAGQAASEQDAAPIHDGYFTDMQGEEAFFGPEQLAQAAAAGGAPVQVPVPADQNVIRVQVTPGEILELSSPFDPNAALLGREENGNLAIKVGDVTVILLGYVEANSTAPVVVETSDGQPIDVATLLASTDPSIDIQTAAGPAAGAQGQGADNTGAILALLQGGTGLGGLNAVGAQDATQLSYGLIDNAIKLDREDALLTTTTAATPFHGLAEPFLRDPFNDTTFTDFTTFFTNYKTDVNTTPGSAWADFTGTAATDTDFDAYLAQTSFTNLVTHTSTTDEPLYIDTNALALQIANMTSDQSHLYIDPATVDPLGHATTVFVRRESDDALILVIHAHEAGNGLSDDTTYSNGDYQIDSYLINRLDHPDQGQDILDLDIPYAIRDLGSGGSEQEEITFTTGNVEVQILDDIPITGETDYYSFLHATSCKDALDCFSAFLGGKITDYVVTDDAGHVDEDYIFHGNHDKDNAAGPDSDPDRGDDIGDKFVVGILNINFGADGPAGKIPAGDGPTKTNPVFHDTDPQALAIAGLKVGDPYPDATSQGHDLVVLKHEKLPFPFSTVEMVQVGYHPDAGTPSGEGLAKTGGDTVVFTLLLQTGPNLPLFGGFVFEQCAPLDHDVAATLESNLPLNFQIIATDDDGDHPIDPVTIHILVNDDAPTFQITYTNEDPKNCVSDHEGSEDVTTFGVSGDVHVGHYTTTDFGHVDEDWLDNSLRKEIVASAGGQGNHDQDGFGNDNANLYGDDKGGLEVCGQIKVKYGADGPSDAPGNGELALKTYTVPVSGPEPVFVNGDGSTLTSDGKPLVVFISTEGHLQVGVAGYIIPDGGSEGEPLVIPAQIVFDLTLDPNTGKFDFQLFGAIDHIPATNPDNGDPETNLVLSFNVGSAEDFDHDKVQGAINIKVNDDHPEVGITYYNEDPGIPALVGYPTHTDTDFGRIDEDWLQGAGGNVESPTIVTIGNQDEDYFGNSNANQFGDDYGSDHLSGQINMKYGADGPGTQTIGLETLGGDFKDADNNQLFSGGNKLVVLHSDAGLLTVGYGNTVVLTLTLDSTGHFDFTQSMPLDHPIHSTIEDNINLAFKAGSITDGDNDTVNAVIKIQVNDDVPETAVTYTDESPEVDTDTFITFGAPVNHFGQVDEDFLVLQGGNQDHDNTPPFSSRDSNRGDEAGGLIVTGDLGGTKYGADGPDGTPGKTFLLTELSAGDAFNDADGNQLKSHGNLLVVLDSDGTTLNVGYGTTAVFTLTMTGTNAFEFELKGPLDDTPKDGGKLEDGLVLVFGAENQGAPTDNDGDPAARIVIHVNDDAPMACEVSYNTFTDASGEDFTTVSNVDGVGIYGQVDEDNIATGQGNLDTDGNPGDQPGSHVATGTVTINFGADGPADIPFSLGSFKVGDLYVDADNNTFTSHGNSLEVLETAADHLVVGYGTTTVFEINLDQVGGGFSFDLQGPLDHPGAGEDTLPVSFNVIATDYDGDTISTKLNIHVNDDAPTVGTVSYDATVFYNAMIHGAIDEDYVAGGNQDNDGFGDGDELGGATLTGTVSVPSFAPGIGADGPAAHPYALEILSTVTDANGNSLTSQFDGTPLVVIGSSATTLEVGHAGGGTVFTLTLDQDSGAYTFTLSQGLDNAPTGDNLETNLPLKFNVIATDYDGDTSTTPINISVNDDRPTAVDDFDESSAYEGNVLANDTKGADDAKVTGASSTTGGDQSADINGDTTVVGALGLLIIHANGDWTYTAAPGTEGGEDTFTYTVTDGDGDTAKATLTITVGEDASDSFRLASVVTGPTHEPAPHYDHEVTVSGLNGIGSLLSSQTYHFEDANGGHLISGGGGNDYIHVTGSTGAVLSGNGGDDIIHGGNGASILKGGAGDDTLFGGSNADSFFGDAGHDAMSGGGGNDTFYKVDADDLTYTNTLDGTHSIDGGTGIDTVDLSVLKTFDSGQAIHLENVEHLAFEGKAAGGGGTAAVLNYSAAYGITEVGGLHQLSITGDSKDSLKLESSGVNVWHETGIDTHVYEAGTGGSKVTLTVDHDVSVTVS